jgi:hypothetical protein
MLVLLAVTIALLGGGKRAAFVVALSPLLLGPVVCQRFDALPALLTLAALLLALRGRYSWSAATLGIGTAVKLYPLLLMPLVVAAAGRRGGAKVLAAFGFAVTCLLAPFLAIAPHGVAAAIHDQLGRHLQMETPLASAALLAQSLVGVNFGLVSQAHSFALGGTRGFVLAVLTTAAFLASLASVWRRMPRLVASREGMIVGWAATLCTAVALGRVLSPQYLIWLLPVVPLVGRGPTLLLVAALVLTNIWYPTQYSAAVHGHGDAIPLLVGRNIVLIALLVVLLRNVSSRSA